jgi:hypothetical protein
MTTATTTAIDPQRLEAFVNRAIQDIAAAYGGVMVGLGHKLACTARWPAPDH